MIHTLDALYKIGVNVSKLNPWERDNDFELLHLWGLDVSQYRIINFAHKANKKIIVTALTGYSGSFLNNVKRKIINKIQWPNYNLQIIKLIDSFVVLNEGQAEFAVDYLNVPENKICIIPAILNDNFYSLNENNNLFSKMFGFTDYILTTGNVGVRKNQLNLALACNKINQKLVIIGNEVTGEEEYANQLKILENNSKCIKWIKELDNSSNLLQSAYVESKIFALVSHEEQQPMSAIEAAKIGKPLILADKTYAKQSYFKNAYLTNINSVENISNAILKILATPEKYIVDTSDYETFSSNMVAEKYLKVYTKLIS